MILVPDEWEDGTFRYVQVERQGDSAIYRQIHKASQIERFEVIKIRVRPAHAWPDGRVTPEHEAYPGATRWGQEGWTFYGIADAKAKMQDLQRERTPDA